jgi:hypothetical protein
MHIFILICAGQVFAGVLQPYNLGYVNGWKYQYGIALGLLLIAVPVLLQRKYLTQFSVAIVIFLSLKYISRSEAGIFLIGFIASRVSIRKQKKQSDKSNNFVTVIFICTSAITIYLISANNGWLGSDESKRAAKISNSSVSILAGRPEIFYTAPALLQSPVIGYGGNPQVSQNFISNINQLIVDRSILGAADLYPINELPIHSYLISSMIFGGLFAGLFWLYYLQTILKILTRVNIKPRYITLSFTLCVLFLWNILFSPFAASQRILAITSLVFLEKDTIKE